MKHTHTKMSRRMPQESERSELERLEQQRIDYEHRARLARQNLYGQPSVDMQKGWVDKTS